MIRKLVSVMSAISRGMYKYGYNPNLKGFKLRCKEEFPT